MAMQQLRVDIFRMYVLCLGKSFTFVDGNIVFQSVYKEIHQFATVVCTRVIKYLYKKNWRRKFSWFCAVI